MTTSGVVTDVVVPYREPSAEEPIVMVLWTRVLYAYLDTKMSCLADVWCCCAPDVVNPNGLVGVMPRFLRSNLPHLRGLLECIMNCLRHLDSHLLTKAGVKVGHEFFDIHLLHVFYSRISLRRKGKMKVVSPPQLTGCFTQENSQKKRVISSGLSPQLTGCFTHKTHRRKGKTLVVSPPISQVVLPTRFTEEKGNSLRVILWWNTGDSRKTKSCPISWKHWGILPFEEGGITNQFKNMLRKWN